MPLSSSGRFSAEMMIIIIIIIINPFTVPLLGTGLLSEWDDDDDFYNKRI